MYRIEDKSSAISEIQRLLHYIWVYNKSISRTPIDGVYGEETVLAVTNFQKEYNLPTTGKVDNVTFDKINNIFGKIHSENDSFLPFRMNSCPYSRGDQGGEIMLLNYFLNLLSLEYREIELNDINSFYSEKTESAVSYLQGVFGQRINGIADQAFIIRLVKEINAAFSRKEIFIDMK